MFEYALRAVERTPVGIPAVRPSRYARALYTTSKKHRFGPAILAPVMAIDYRGLERNRYAPWGVGSLSGLKK